MSPLDRLHAGIDADEGRTAESVERINSTLVHLRHMWRARDALVLEMLDQTGQAMLITEATLRVRHMTEGARALIDRADGIRHVMGRLVLDDRRAHRRLLAAVDGVVNQVAGTPDALLCPRSSASHPLRVVARAIGDAMPGCVMLILDDPAARPDPDRIRRFARAYGLTAAEIALAEGLAADRTLEAIAAERDVAKETIRTQLRSLFLKAGVRRQGDLIRLIIQMP